MSLKLFKNSKIFVTFINIKIIINYKVTKKNTLSGIVGLGLTALALTGCGGLSRDQSLDSVSEEKFYLQGNPQSLAAANEGGFYNPVVGMEGCTLSREFVDQDGSKSTELLRTIQPVSGPVELYRPPGELSATFRSPGIVSGFIEKKCNTGGKVEITVDQASVLSYGKGSLSPGEIRNIFPIQ